MNILTSFLPTALNSPDATLAKNNAQTDSTKGKISFENLLASFGKSSNPQSEVNSSQNLKRFINKNSGTTDTKQVDQGNSINASKTIDALTVTTIQNSNSSDSASPSIRIDSDQVNSINARKNINADALANTKTDENTPLAISTTQNSQISTPVTPSTSIGRDQQFKKDVSQSSQISQNAQNTMSLNDLTALSVLMGQQPGIGLLNPSASQESSGLKDPSSQSDSLLGSLPGKTTSTQQAIPFSDQASTNENTFGKEAKASSPEIGNLQFSTETLQAVIAKLGGINSATQTLQVLANGKSKAGSDYKDSKWIPGSVAKTNLPEGNLDLSSQALLTKVEKAVTDDVETPAFKTDQSSTVVSTPNLSNQLSLDSTHRFGEQITSANLNTNSSDSASPSIRIDSDQVNSINARKNINADALANTKTDENTPLAISTTQNSQISTPVTPSTSIGRDQQFKKDVSQSSQISQNAQNTMSLNDLTALSVLMGQQPGIGLLNPSASQESSGLKDPSSQSDSLLGSLPGKTTSTQQAIPFSDQASTNENTFGKEAKASSPEIGNLQFSTETLQAVIAKLGGINSATQTLQVLANGKSKAGSDYKDSKWIPGSVAKTNLPEGNLDLSSQALLTKVEKAVTDDVETPAFKTDQSSTVVSTPNLSNQLSLDSTHRFGEQITSANLNTNSTQQTISTPFQSVDWGPALQQRVTWMIKDKLQNATITVTPEHLGPIEVKMQTDANKQTSVQFFSNNPDVRQAIQDGIPALREMMNQSGLQLGQADVGSRNQQSNLKNKYSKNSQGTESNTNPFSIAALNEIDSSHGIGLINTYA